MKRFLCFVLALIMLISVCSCTKTNDNETGTTDTEQNNGEESIDTTPPPREVTVTDSAGREVTTSATNGDIISIGFEATSVLVSLGVEKRITGVEYGAKDSKLISLAFEDVADVPVVTTEDGALLHDVIINQQPGLVVLTTEYGHLVEVLEHSNITCAVVALDTIENIEKSISLVGTLVNSDERASKLWSYYKSTFDRLKVLTATEEKKSVTIYNNDEFLNSMVSNITCDIVDDGEYVIAPLGEDVENAITVPEGIERWDEPSVSLVLGIYWYTHSLYPQVISITEMSQRAINFYSEFYNITVTAEDLGIDLPDDPNS